MILMNSFGGGASSVSFTHAVTLSRQVFIATEGQSVFTITAFTLTAWCLLVIDDVIQTSNHTIAGQTISLTFGLHEGSRVVVYGISGTVTGMVRKQEFTATEGQTVFPVTVFTLTDNFIVVMNDVIQSDLVREGNDIILGTGVTEGSKIIIYG